MTINNDMKNFVWNFLGLTINSFNSLFFLVIVNWINGSSNGGIFTFAFSLCCLTYFIGTYFNRTYQITNPNNYKVKEFVLNRIISIILMFIVTLSYSLIFRYDIYKFSVIIGLCLFKMLESFSEIMYGIETEHNELHKSGKSMFLKGLLSVLLFLIIDLLTNNMLYAIYSIVFVNLLSILFYDIPNCKKYINKEYKFKNILHIFKYTFPIFLFSFLNNYLINSSKYTLDFFEPSEIQNIYGIILMPGTVMGLCTGYILNPYINELKEYKIKKEYNKLKRQIYKIIKYILLLGIFTLICAFIFGIPLLNVVYHIKLDEYKYQMLLIIFGSIFLAVTIIFSNILTIMNKNTVQMILYLINSIISLILSVFMIRIYGILGATITYSIAMFIQGIEFYITFNYYYKKMEVE